MPITDFRTRLASILKRLRERKHPVILTHNGKATAVLLSVEAYEDLMDKLEATKQPVDLIAKTSDKVEAANSFKAKKPIRK